MGLFLFLVGLCVGSFLNVCIYRIPKGESIISPRSHCPNCKAEIKAKDNIPLLSYLILKGRCHYCNAKISIQYFLIELSAGLLVLFSYFRFGLSLNFLSAILFCLVLLLVSVIDLKHQTIPDKVIFLSSPLQLSLVLLASYASGGKLSQQIISSLSGFLFGGGFLLLVALLAPLIFKQEGMGGGDVKLAAYMGLILGGSKIFVALFIGFLVGAVAGLILMLLKVKGRKDLIPFGPFLSLGGFIALFFGENLILWYLGMLR